MRLREMQRILQVNVPNLAPNVEAANIGGQQGRRLKNIETVREAVFAVREIRALHDQADHVLKQDPIRNWKNGVVAYPQEVDPAIGMVNALREKAVQLLTVLDVVLPPEDACTLVIQLPDVRQLGTLSDLAREVGGFLDQTIGIANTAAPERLPAQTAEVRAFDTGSLFWEILLPATLVLYLVGKIVSAGLRVRAELRDQEFQEKRLEAVGTTVEEMKAARSMNAKLRKSLTRKLAEHIATSSKDELPKLQPEDINRIVMLIDKNVEFIDQGLRLLPAYTAPPATQDLFPRPSEFLLPKKPDLLTEGGDDSVDAGTIKAK